MNSLSRTIKLIGNEAVQKLKNCNTLVVGVGGVGGLACELLCRSGIENFTVVDNDIVDITNINRQIIATFNTVGQLKVKAMSDRLLSINDKANIRAMPIVFNEQSVSQVFDRSYDFVVDAIDSVKDKCTLIKFCVNNNIKIISSMGSGNRFDIPSFKIVDLSKTKDDGLAKAVRTRLRKDNIIHTPCVCASTSAVSSDGEIGSIAYYPSAASTVIAAYVINSILSCLN